MVCRSRGRNRDCISFSYLALLLLSYPKVLSEFACTVRAVRCWFCSSPPHLDIIEFKTLRSRSLGQAMLFKPWSLERTLSFRESEQAEHGL